MKESFSKVEISPSLPACGVPGKVVVVVDVVVVVVVVVVLT